MNVRPQDTYQADIELEEDFPELYLPENLKKAPDQNDAVLDTYDEISLFDQQLGRFDHIGWIQLLCQQCLAQQAQDNYDRACLIKEKTLLLCTQLKVQDATTPPTLLRQIGTLFSDTQRELQRESARDLQDYTSQEKFYLEEIVKKVAVYKLEKIPQNLVGLKELASSLKAVAFEKKVCLKNPVDTSATVRNFAMKLLLKSTYPLWH